MYGPWPSVLITLCVLYEMSLIVTDMCLMYSHTLTQENQGEAEHKMIVCQQ